MKSVTTRVRSPVPGRVARAVLLIPALWGLAAAVWVGLAWTSWPGRAYRWLAAEEYRPPEPPHVIVMLGGAGIPSAAGLMRTFYTAEWALRHPEATVILCQTAAAGDEDSDLVRTQRELSLRGVAPDRIVPEPSGRNTREQALRVSAILGADVDSLTVAVVTSPSHVRRSVLAFRRAGIQHAFGVGAFDTMRPVDVRYEAAALGGEPTPLAPDLGGRTFLRYGIWNNLRYQLEIAAELGALAYYRLRGWV